MSSENKVLSNSAEDYLIEIFRQYEQKKEIIKITDIVNKLKVPPSSATEMLQRLANRRYVSYKPFKGVKLTKKGFEKAKKLVRRHRIVERFLTDLLMIKPIDAHKEACKLEHNLSPLVEEKLLKVLSFPKFCPHGNTIDIKDDPIKYDTIFDLNENQNAKIMKFLDERVEILELIYALDLNIGSDIRLIKKYENNLLIEVNKSNKPIVLDRNLASKIGVLIK